MQQSKVFITGMGIVSAIGMDVETTLDSLVSSRSGLGKIRLLDTRLKEKLIAGEIPYTDEELLQMAGIDKVPGISRATLLGMIATKQAVRNSDFENDEKLQTGLISGTTAESMTSIEKYLPDFLSNDSRNEYIESQDWGFSTEIIAKSLGINGFMTTINTACSSASNAIMLGARMIRQGRLDRAIVGGTDALSKVMLNGFNSLMIVDPEPCKPFDDNRHGLNIGEGAAFFVLESEQVADRGKMIAEITGYGNANDAHHLTALSPDGKGAFLAMKNALESCNLNPGDISYLNVHGTGTLNNDLSEAIAIEKLFGKTPPVFSSTKPFTGHTLGSSGAIEAVISILALQHDLVFPNLNFSTPMHEVQVRPETSLVKNVEILHVMSNSLGFGGNNTSLIFSKVES
ncbi:MAG: beta-ketoacyl-[acyl-carrier-protein] synthase family protein [Chlorobi bacterium]|nr:beta-ketoacyl-[acyl-carrier-protein] synthase family protein [Chlorobiota bacterium]